MNTELLRDTYSKPIRMYIAGRLQGPAVDDVLQQVFLKAHQKLESIEQPKAIKSRLYRITQHTIIDRYRKEYGGTIAQPDAFFRESLEEDTDQKNKQIIMKNISSCLLPMIDDLDDKSREVMERYLQPEINQKMIAEELGLSLSNVKVIIHRAKEKLKDMYEQCCYQYRDQQGHIIDTRCSKDCGCGNRVVV